MVQNFYSKNSDNKSDQKVAKKIFKIEGPFDSSYSLALLNRYTAITLNALGYTVILHSTEGPGDFPPDEKFLQKNPLIDALYKRSLEPHSYDVQTRNLYPPRVADMDGKISMLHHYAWEESGFPAEWVESFNKHLDLISCISEHVKKILIDNGVTIPLFTTGCGADHIFGYESDNNFISDLLAGREEKFKFLHISSCFPRKGAELLLEAYSELFDKKDDTLLIIKTFKNPHNNIESKLTNLKLSNHDFPDVLLIFDDLTDAQVKSLYETADVLVQPSYAEGFGLPVAEAMALELPVITTGWGGHMDFCNDKNAFLIDYDFDYTDTHFNLFDSIWAVPKKESLKRAMLAAYNQTAEDKKEMTSAARYSVLSKFSWEKVCKRLVNAVENYEPAQLPSRLKIGWLSTFNTKCGIASYSKFFIDNLKSEDIIVFAPLLKGEEIVDEAAESSCIRVWVKSKSNSYLNTILDYLKYRHLDILVIQFNYGFFNHDELANFIGICEAKGVKVIIVMHSTHDPEFLSNDRQYRLSTLAESLKKCARVIVHTPNDMNRLKNLGIIDNVCLFPQGVIDCEPKKLKNSDKFIISTFGYCLPHKGLLEMIDAFKILYEENNNLRLKMYNALYPVDISKELADNIRNKISSLNLDTVVEFNTEYLADKQSVDALASADLVVFPYQQTGESSSAAIRFALASKTPVAVTPSDIFSDVSKIVYRLNGFSPEEIASNLKEIIPHIQNNTDEHTKKMLLTDKWIKEHKYSLLAKRLLNLIKSLLLNP